MVHFLYSLCSSINLFEKQSFLISTDCCLQYQQTVRLPVFLCNRTEIISDLRTLQCLISYSKSLYTQNICTHIICTYTHANTPTHIYIYAHMYIYTCTYIYTFASCHLFSKNPNFVTRKAKIEVSKKKERGVKKENFVEDSQNFKNKVLKRK